jgi:peptidoglycan/LPS O-acetylase OafA/YrhL
MDNKNCFDFLRFFFAFTILLAHLWELSGSKSLAFLSSFTNSAIAVQGFFVISGFLVAKSYTNTPSLKQYFIKRAKRILPAYFFVILFSTIVLSVFSTYNYSDYFSNISTYKYFGWNLIFMNFVHPCLPGLFDNNLLCAVNGALWTLKVEEGFYVVLPLIFYLITKFKKPTLILATIYILSLIYWFVMQFYFNKPLFAKQLPGYLSYFAVGIFLFLNFKSFLKHKSKFLILSIAAITVSSIFPQNFDILYPAAFGSIVLLAAYNLPFLNNFGKYGDFTYGLYIFHFPIIQLFRFYNLFERFNPFLMAISILIITFIFALFSWFFIEKRFLDRYKSSTKTVLT